MSKRRILRFIKRYVIGLITLYVLIGIMAYYMLTQASSTQVDDKVKNLKIENQFGELKSFNDYKGQVLLVDFWFQGCQPCLEEMRFFPQLLEKYGSDLAIMSISIDPKEATRYLLEQKPKPWNFLEADNKNWTFYNDNLKDYSLVSSLNVKEYPTYILFDKAGNLINTPFSGVAGVENEMSGIFGFDITFKTNWFMDASEKLPYLIIPYSILTFLILLLQALIFGIRKLRTRHKTN